MLIDNALITYGVISVGDSGAALISLYLMVSLGCLFRYGRLYMHASQAMAVAGLSFALIASPFWSRNIAVGLGFLLTLVLVPNYVGVLLHNVVHSRKSAGDV